MSGLLKGRWVVGLSWPHWDLLRSVQQLSGRLWDESLWTGEGQGGSTGAKDLDVSCFQSF